MGKYDIIDKEFVREPEHAAEIISNVVYKGRLEVRPQDPVELHEKCKSNRNREAELERDALFLCPKHAVKYGIEVENYHTELRQFIEAMQARYDKKKLSSLFKREEFQNLSTLTQKALAVHLDNNQISRKVIEEGENMCKALRDLEKDWKREGEQKRLLYQLCKKARKGKSLNVMAEELEMEQEELEAMYNVVMKFSPNYDVERVCEYLGDRILI